MRQPFILLSIVLLSTLSLSLSAQSISGSVTSFSSKSDLGFANVDIYKGADLIASVLADMEGNFTVKLDTGMYRVEIIYAGYKKIRQTIHVTDDETADFSLKEDAESKYKPIKGKKPTAEGAGNDRVTESYAVDA